MRSSRRGQSKGGGAVKVVNDIRQAVKRGIGRYGRELKDGNKSVKLQKRSGDLSWVSRRTNSSEEIWIGTIRDKERMIRKKKKDFKRMGGAKEVIT